MLSVFSEKISLLLAAEASVALAFLWVASTVVYRLFFHPLKSHPGPLLGRITNWYAAYHAWKGDIHLDMHACHEKYGPMVRYTPNRLLINTQQALNDIYSVPKNVRKSPQYSILVHRGVNTLTLTDKKEHARRRKIMSSGFSDAALNSFEDIVISQINRLTTHIGEQCTTGWSSTIDMSKICNYLAFDIMSNIIFGIDFNLVANEKYRYVVSAIEDSNVRIAVLLQSQRLKFMRFDKWLFPTAIKGRNEFVKFVAKLLYKRFGQARQQAPQNDMVTRLINENNETGKSQRLSMEEISAEGATLVVAGSDTTSTALAGFLFYISRFPSVRERVMNEIRSTFDSVEEIRSGQKLASCTYMMACINETMRISPSVGAAPWREVEPQGLEIEGHFIPGGCEVGTSFYSMHHNPEYHRDPEQFIPDRWLGDGAYGPDPRKAFFPFSLGIRGCIGKSLALKELQLTVARLLFTFDMREGAWSGPGEPTKDEFPLHDHLTCAKRGPFMEFAPRKLVE